METESIDIVIILMVEFIQIVTHFLNKNMMDGLLKIEIVKLLNC